MCPEIIHAQCWVAKPSKRITPTPQVYATPRRIWRQHNMLHADMASHAMASAMTVHYSTNRPMLQTGSVTNRRGRGSFTSETCNPSQLWRNTYMTYVTKWFAMVCIQICRTSLLPRTSLISRPINSLHWHRSDMAISGWLYIDTEQA
jgi:hypothetical protein